MLYGPTGKYTKKYRVHFQEGLPGPVQMSHGDLSPLAAAHARRHAPASLLPVTWFDLLMIIHFQYLSVWDLYKSGLLIPVWGCWNRSSISDITAISGSLATTGESNMNPPEFWRFFDMKPLRRSHTLLPHQEARILEASQEMGSMLPSGRVHQLHQDALIIIKDL